MADSARQYARIITIFAICAFFLLGNVLCVPSFLGAFAAAPNKTVSVSVNAPNTVHPGEDLVVAVALSSSFPGPVNTGTVELYLTPRPIREQSVLSEWTNPESNETNFDLGNLIEKRPVNGTTTSFEFHLPHPIDESGSGETLAVYGISAKYVADNNTSAQGRTVTVWQNGAPSHNVEFTIVAPITTRPTSIGLIPATTLETLTAPDGILTQQLQGVINRPNVVLAIDPMIITSIRVLGSSAPASAQDWLTHLSRSTNEKFPLSYADSDLSVQFQAGQSTVLQPFSFDYAIDPAHFTSPPPTPTPSAPSPSASPPTENGTQPSPSVTSPPTQTPSPSPSATTSPAPAIPHIPSRESLQEFPYSLSGIAWPNYNTVTTATLESLTANGYSTTILAGTNITSSTILPSGATTTNNVSTLVSYPPLDVALRQAINAHTDAEWREALSSASAQLSLISTDEVLTSHTGNHSAFTVLPREWNTTSQRISSTIAQLSELGWVTPTTLTTQLTRTPTETTLNESPEPTERIATVTELLTDETTLTQFSSALTNPEQLTAPQRNNLLALLANSWTSQPHEWEQAVFDRRAYTKAQLNAIEIVPSSEITQVGVEASIPITLGNDLDYPTTIVLHADPTNARLQIQSTLDVSIEPHSRKTVRIPTTARVGNGEVTLTLDLFTPTGVHIDGPSYVTVNVRADWEGIGALILAALVIGFFGFGLFRTIRRRQREKSAEQLKYPTDSERPSDSADPEHSTNTGDNS